MTGYPHIQLTAEGTLGASAGNEIWSCGLHVAVTAVGAPTVPVAPSEAELAELAVTAAAAWQALITTAIPASPYGALFSTDVNLVAVKAAAVQADGHYDPAVAPVLQLPPTPGSARGLGATNLRTTPYQVALAVTLRGDAYIRGSGALGRFYLPCPNLEMNPDPAAAAGLPLTDGLLQPGAVTAFSTAAAALVTSINGDGIFAGGRHYAVANLGSSTDLAGLRWQEVTKVVVDNRPDTIRRRYSALSGGGKVLTAV